MYVDRRNSKNRDDFQMKIEEKQNFFSDSQMEPEREQNCFSNQNNCSKNKSHKFTCHQNKDVFRRISHDSDSSDLTVNPKTMKRDRSDMYVDRRNSKNKDNFQVKTEEEQNYFSDYQIESEKESNSIPNQNKSVFRRIAHENDCSYLTGNNKRIKRAQSDFYNDRRNSKNRDNIMAKTEEEQIYFSDSHMEPEIEQNCFPNQNNCSKNKNNNFIYNQNKGVFRRISHENDSSGSKVNHKRIRRTHSDIYVDRRNFKNRDDFQVKAEEEQNYFSDKNSSSKKKSHKIDVSKNCAAKSSHSKSKNSCSVHKTADNIEKNHRQKIFSSIPDDDGGESFGDKNSSAVKTSSSEILKRKCSRKNYFYRHFDNEADIERVQLSISNDCSDKRTLVFCDQRKKEAVTRLLSNLLPPNTDLLKTEKLIQTALKCQPKDIPEEVRTLFLGILKYNQGLKKKDVNEDARFFLNWIKVVLSKIEKEKFKRKKCHLNHTQHPSKEEERVKGGTSAAPKQQSSKKREITLSVGISEAISKTVGEIQPKLLCNFLNQVRGRKKWLEVASAFTKNIPGLASQLLEVVNIYYKYVEKRGPEEDRDIHYLKRLHQKLLQHIKITTQTSSDDKEDIIEVNFKTESNMTEIPVTIEPSVTQAVKTELDTPESGVESQENITEVNFKTESDVTETSVKIEPGMIGLAVKTELDMMEHLKSEADITDISIKKETETFMRQSSSYGDSFNENLSYGLYGASYFTNIVQMPFPFTSIKTEINDTE